MRELPSWTLVAAMVVPLVLAAVPGLTVSQTPSTTDLETREHVVVATLDTGTNPFHPTWRRDRAIHPSNYIQGFPADAPELNLTFEDSFSASVDASEDEIRRMQDEGDFPYWIPGTNIVGTWAHPDDRDAIFDLGGDSHSHGAQASSQLAGDGYSIAPNVSVVVMDRTVDGGSVADIYRANAEGIYWAANRSWIDIIHTNIQNPVPMANNNNPFFTGYPEAVRYAVDQGKLVVSAAGNFVAEPSETSPHTGPVGVLSVGANDNCGPGGGYTYFSNPNPHVVMDGARTVSAAPNGFGDDGFGGTSSSSPRTTGYAAQLLLQIRQAVDHDGRGDDGALVVVDDPADRPADGPLADGRLTAKELHAVIRRTADPNPHPSRFDGAAYPPGLCIPQGEDLPVSNYPKMGYGEVSEHTLPLAVDVVLGEEPMPFRPVADAYYDGSRTARSAAWAPFGG